MDYKQKIADLIAAAVDNQLTADQISAKIEVPKTLDLGDYAFPAFMLAKILRKAPQAIAQDLVAKLPQDGFEKIEAVGPYINFFLDKQAYSQEILQNVLTAGAHYGDQNLGDQGNVPIDMSSPNIAKPMSMGHLRSTVIGNSIAELLKKTNYKPIKIDYLGDWGTQFGKLIQAYKMWGNEADVKNDPINTLLKYYVHFHEEADKDPELNDKARAWFKKLQDGDQEATELWQWFRSESLNYFMKIYKELGVEFDSFNGESFFNDKMDEIIELLREKNLLKESQGAQIVDLDKYDLNPALILRSDGGTLYITRDLAAALYRYRTYNFKQSLYVVGSEQTGHFQQLKAVLKEMGYDWSDDIKHIPFGLITSGGKKLSTRKGRVILLENVLNDAVDLAYKQIEAKNPDLANKQEVAHDVGVGAVIFHDLKNDRMNNFDFDLEEVVRFEGETGPYVQYSHARAMSILRKANMDIPTDQAYALDDPEAWETLRLLGDFPATVKRAVEEYEPSVIAKYAIHLAKAFNKYYAHSRILTDDEQKASRLAMVKGLTIVLKESLRLLGVQAPDEM
ncbi:arginine--tRNA ligase [Ligilactobacillus saerimneri]|uniref:arginine--tRNA ligase n=1 Tax=Ligilactobacillus saerimneri TaxID=228229 RepID=UPI00242BB436|nr:arginine--tRNA ligase [Ligilactobacillus saerimneri]